MQIFKSGAVVAALLLAHGHSCAAYTLNIVQIGPDVVASGSGSIKTTAGVFVGNPGSPPVIIPNLGTILVGSNPPTDLYAMTTVGPADFGPGAGTLATSGVGDAAGLNPGAWVVVPVGYVSGAPLTPSTTVWAGTTIAALGMTSGTYTWTWGAGPDADAFTLVIASSGGSGVASVPTLNEWALLAMSGLLSIAAFGVLRRRKF